MHRTGRRPRAFTIVELIVIISIIGLLMALLIPALNTAQTRGRKLNEANNARSLAMAWNLYGNANNSAAAPGFIAPDVQQNWRVRYEFPFAPDPTNAPSLKDIPPGTAAPWTWRLLSYVDYNAELIWGYRGEATLDVNALVLDPSGDDPGNPLRARNVAYEPAFGYNGYHIGGVWCQPDGESRPRFMLDDAEDINNNPVTVVSRSIANIRRADELVLFAASTRINAAGSFDSFSETEDGWHLVSPPRLGDVTKWRVPPTSDSIVQTANPPTFLPIYRYGESVTVALADGSTAAERHTALLDMQRWVDQATTRDFFFTAGTIECSVNQPGGTIPSDPSNPSD